MVFLGKFYLKNGAIIEEKAVLDEDSISKEEIKEVINDIKKCIGRGFKENMDFNVMFGSTIVRGSELAAFTIIEVGEE